MKFIILCLVPIVMFGCEHKNAPPEINVELYGRWSSNDNLCNLELVKDGALIKVGEFTSVGHESITNMPLNFTKNGIYSLFGTKDTKLNFNIVYVEGELTIDKYCKEPLHKVAN